MDNEKLLQIKLGVSEKLRKLEEDLYNSVAGNYRVKIPPRDELKSLHSDCINAEDIYDTGYIKGVKDITDYIFCQIDNDRDTSDD